MESQLYVLHRMIVMRTPVALQLVECLFRQGMGTN